MLHLCMPPDPSIVFQSAKLGDISKILEELAWAEKLLLADQPVGRVFGLSGGNLVALAFTLELAARRWPEKWGKAKGALADLRLFLTNHRSWQIRSLNLNPWYGFYNLRPLRRWLSQFLQNHSGRTDFRISELGVPVYFCAIDHDAIPTLHGLPDESLQCDYPFVHIGPPCDALILDAVIASLSTLLSTSPTPVNDKWVYDCRPAASNAVAWIIDLQASDPRPILRRLPYTPVRRWTINWFTSSFIMHSQAEQNQSFLAEYYADLWQRHRALQQLVNDFSRVPPEGGQAAAVYPTIRHIDLPYIGSTEAATNMRESVANRQVLLARFEALLAGQFDSFPFDEPANIIYGAGGFSGILGGLTAARAVNQGFRLGGGHIQQIYGVSAGVLNGFFHAVEVAARRHPGLYCPAAQRALKDLEEFMAACTPARIAELNKNPARFWSGWANLNPLENFLRERLAAYTGVVHPDSLTFDDIQLPMTIVTARADGFSDFLGMTSPERKMRFAGRVIQVQSAAILRAMIAGWSMNTYIQPTALNGQLYTDGGGTFYDIGLFAACLDQNLTNQLNIHLDEPDGHTYNLGPHINFLHIIFDTQNLTFPEERRRMRALANLLYEHYRLRRTAQQLGLESEDDFRQIWDIPTPPAGL